jgi:hypothetical protein
MKRADLVRSFPPVAVAAAAARSALGSDLVQHRTEILAGRSGLKPLVELWGRPPLWGGE